MSLLRRSGMRRDTANWHPLIMLLFSIILMSVCRSAFSDDMWMFLKEPDDIRRAQSILKEVGIYKGGLNGVASEEFRQAVRASLKGFKVRKGNPADVAFVLDMYLGHWASQNKNKSGAVADATTIIPPGSYRLTENEGGNFRHIIHHRIWTFYSGEKCSYEKTFENITNTRVNESAVLLGDCSLVHVHSPDSEKDLILFSPKAKSGSNWQIDDLFDLLVSGGSRGFPLPLSYELYGSDLATSFYDLTHLELYKRVGK